jgi:predicted Zn-dependent peptidase
MVRAGAGSFRDSGVVQIQAGLDPARLPEAMRVIKDELKKISTTPVSDKELADAKSNFSGRLVLAMEDTHAQADWWARQFWFANKMESYDLVLAKIKKVTANEVLRLAKKLFDWQQVRVAAVGPMKKSDVIKLL